MSLDIRIPIGLMFGLLGAILVVFGALTDPTFGPMADSTMYHRSLDVNVNLIWGLVLLLFSTFMLSMARRALRSAKDGADRKPAGPAER